MRCPAFVLAAFALFATAMATRSAAATNPPASRYAAIVLDAETGAVLYERNADLPRYPASLTKIMTLYLAFEAIGAKNLSLTDQLVMSTHAVSRDPSRLDLAPGSKLKVEDAIRAMTTKSANDAAAAIAERLGGSEQRFAQMMTAKAKKLGLSHTVFRNASGLPEEGQVSTARELALLCHALIRDYPEQYRYFSMRTFDYRGTRYPNQNRFLRTYYGADGIKTGFVNASGHNLAASAVRGGKRLIAVVLGGDTQSWTREHTTRLLDVSYAKVDPSLVMVASAETGDGAAPGASTATTATTSTATTTSAAVAGPASTGAATAPAPSTTTAGTAAPEAPTAPAVTMVTYATPAGAVTRPSAASLPLPNATANLSAYASAASAPSIPAGSVPASPPLPPSGPPAASRPGPVANAAAPAVDASPAKPSPIAPLDPAPQAALPVSDPDTAAAIRATDQAAARPSMARVEPSSPAPKKAAAAAPKVAEAAAAVSAAEPPAAVQQAASPTAPAPAPAAAPIAERVVTNAGGGDWSVQVGLYRDATVARRRGEEARERMPLALRNADLVVGRALDGVHVTSRIGRLSEQEARAACSELQRGSFPCVVVPPGRPLVVATN